MDASSDDGLTEMCRNAIFLAGAAIASVLERELFDGPITLEKLTALLNGELGMAMVLRCLFQPVLLGLGIRDDQFSC